MTTRDHHYSLVDAKQGEKVSCLELCIGFHYAPILVAVSLLITIHFLMD